MLKRRENNAMRRRWRKRESGKEKGLYVTRALRRRERERERDRTNGGARVKRKEKKRWHAQRL